MDHFNQLLEFYVRLAQSPGWRQYTRARVLELAAECPELYRDLPGLVADRVNNPATSAPSSTPTTPSPTSPKAG